LRALAPYATGEPLAAGGAAGGGGAIEAGAGAAELGGGTNGFHSPLGEPEDALQALEGRAGGLRRTATPQRVRANAVPWSHAER
jgi:hypothetical protein